jgi:predicted signal transduction protein with EAL and GGDEF domain
VEPFLIDGHDLRVGASIGISVYPQDGQDAETLLRLADIAMYRAKQDSGGEATRGLLQPGHEPGHAGTHAPGNRLAPGAVGTATAAALPAEIRAGSGRIIGAEALVRWHHPQRGWCRPPNSSRWPKRRAWWCRSANGCWKRPARRRRPGSWPACRRSAWPSTCRPANSRRPCPPVAATLARYGLEPSWLELEITESTLMHNIDRVIGIMDRITALGVTLSLDDFGTGYSSCPTSSASSIR